MDKIKSGILAAIIAAVMLTGCGTSNDIDTDSEAVQLSYGSGIEAAKAEFHEIFSEFDGLEITETSTMARSDSDNRFVVQFTYTSDRGDGVYGFECAKIAGDEVEIVRHGADVTIDALVGKSA